MLAFNAGMYQSDFSPLGLYVEDGEALRPADTTSMNRPPRQIPNFYKKPNGIFFLGETGAGILPTDKFLDAQPPLQFSTQSGPMLVIRGELHPALIRGSTDQNHVRDRSASEKGRWIGPPPARVLQCSHNAFAAISALFVGLRGHESGQDKHVGTGDLEHHALAPSAYRSIWQSRRHNRTHLLGIAGNPSDESPAAFE